MKNESIVVDHLKVALLATTAERPLLAYLIQMALIESESAPEDLQFRDDVDERDEETPHYSSASEFLARLPQSQRRARIKTSFL
ncbi:hypothetical protein G6L16_023445 [Agrobacterium tumefaciens]|uniref:hypothetical protein n=1 Tax=Agrobacterium tumefaciens TaxID=358 RepID=UPI00157304AE|nr:hypothetical protein [Agrobacterium tumefaciens]NSZ66984.1 hypothetical protein [Agrobacterium tumefaciens]NTA73345.1 hypothetical protein [Agrobacterium tumefaciens]WIE41147.1 hypothetical protein G6L16_023445 [Agrobacterium tumefaciens]